MKALIMTALIIQFFQSCMKKSTSVLVGETRIEQINTSTTTTKVCVRGKRLSLWLDNDNDKIEDSKLGTFISYSGNLTSKDNYNYFSASAHPIIGPEPSGFKSTVFFYDGLDGLSMVFFHNIDAGGSDENEVHWTIEVEGNEMKDEVLISDDGNELRLLERGNDLNLYQAKFKYWKNTDGGAIGPLEGEDFKIYVKNIGAGDIEDSRFYSANGNSLNLANDDQVVDSFIIKYESFENCK